MYVELTSLLRATGIPVMDFVTYVRNEIKEKTGCPCSAGIGSNRIQARMATKQAKPNGQYYLTPDEVVSYFRDIKTTDLPGVGRSTMFKLEKKNWNSCGDLQKVSKISNKMYKPTMISFCSGATLPSATRIGEEIRGNSSSFGLGQGRQAVEFWTDPEIRIC